jgi:hypothetical protein
MEKLISGLLAIGITLLSVVGTVLFVAVYVLAIAMTILLALSPFIVAYKIIVWIL